MNYSTKAKEHLLEIISQAQEALVALEKAKKGWVWKPERGASCFRLDDQGNTVPVDFPDFWERSNKQGNMFETEEEAKKEERKRAAIKRINDAITEINEGWTPNWLNQNQTKYSAAYLYPSNQWIVEKHCMTKNLTSLNYCKGEHALKKIVQDYKDAFMELVL